MRSYYASTAGATRYYTERKSYGDYYTSTTYYKYGSYSTGNGYYAVSYVAGSNMDIINHTTNLLLTSITPQHITIMGLMVGVDGCYSIKKPGIICIGITDMQTISLIMVTHISPM